MRIALALAALLAAGCAAIGPASIQSGRLSYTEAINQTDVQQTLLQVVRNRYDESVTLLGVSSVAASINISSSATVSLPFGKPAYYTGSLVPFSGTVQFDESPTISYAPVQGRQYLVQFMSPVPLEVLVALARTAPDPAPLLTLLVSRINDVPNPVYLPTGAAEPDARFTRIVGLIGRLRTAGRLNWAVEAGEAARFTLVIAHYAPDNLQEVQELLRLLGAPPPADTARPVLLPVLLAVEAPGSGGIGVETRSAYELVQLLGAAIELPEQHARAGVVADSPPLGWAGRSLRIRWSASEPPAAAVAVKYRGLWYYIDDSDRATKNAFRVLHALISMVVGESIKGTSGAPVLTVPVR